MITLRIPRRNDTFESHLIFYDGKIEKTRIFFFSSSIRQDFIFFNSMYKYMHYNRTENRELKTMGSKLVTAKQDIAKIALEKLETEKCQERFIKKILVFK